MATNFHTHGLHVSPSGTFWYHPHHHMSVAKQMFAGLAGVIIIEDAIDKQGEFKNSTDRVLMYAAPRIESDSSIMDTYMMDQAHGRLGDFLLINGQLNPQIISKPNVIERWRILNACSSRYLNLNVDSSEIGLISTDGGRLPEAVLINSIKVVPGQRVEVLIKPIGTGTHQIFDGKKFEFFDYG